jgi:hypothetical protein
MSVLTVLNMGCLLESFCGVPRVRSVADVPLIFGSHGDAVRSDDDPIHGDR